MQNTDSYIKGQTRKNLSQRRVFVKKKYYNILRGK